jgi:hypothetical protein
MRDSLRHEVGVEQLDGVTPNYCRVVLQYFDHHSTEVATVDDLVAYIRDQDPSEQDETHIAIRLHHVTLPKLADGGCIDYDPKSNTARFQGHQARTT